MASLIVHSDLSNPGAAIRQPIYVRPILQPHEMFRDIEIVPPSELLVDVVYRAFHRMFEGNGNAPPAAPSVRIVNLSVGDPDRVFVRRLSPLARLLDSPAYANNLVIIVSGGNHDPVRPTLDADVLSGGTPPRPCWHGPCTSERGKSRPPPPRRSLCAKLAHSGPREIIPNEQVRFDLLLGLA